MNTPLTHTVWWTERDPFTQQPKRAYIDFPSNFSAKKFSRKKPGSQYGAIANYTWHHNHRPRKTE